MRKKPHTDIPDFEDLEDRPSRTEQKKAMARLQLLGEKLAALPPERIKALPVNEVLIDNLLEMARIPSFEARRRQSQLIGKLLKREDEGAVLATFNAKQPAKKQAQITRWVDRLIAQGDGSLNDFVRQFPAAERHTLRQHVMRVQKAKVEQASEEEQADVLRALENYVHQVALLSD
ncbi:ribosome biogenesis factor YjgA [Aquirhabdus sp.]|uniref:ribosome biogenesis factor YjgA n=1 Tax=Aquirhabdus sp. TaxID=2824160 RepID=UPI00396CA7E4